MNRSIALVAAVFSAFLQIAVLAGLEAAAMPSAATQTILHTGTAL